MIAMQGTIQNRQIVLDAPANLPEGTRVEVLPIDGARPTLGMREEDWPTTPEGIAALLARMDQIEPEVEGEVEGTVFGFTLESRSCGIWYVWGLPTAAIGMAGASLRIS